MVSSQKTFAPFVGGDGSTGRVALPFQSGPAGLTAELTLADGRRAFVDTSFLQLQADGSYVVPLRVADLTGHAQAPSTVVPLIQEQLELHKHRVQTGKVRVVKSVVVEDQIVDLPVTREEVFVERVPVERFVTEPPPIRREGDVTVISLLEEVVVVEKRLIVREEIRLTTRRVVSHEPHAVSLRKEVASVERLPNDNSSL